MKRIIDHGPKTGFTLVELMIAMFLASFVVVAAFHIQATYQSALHRQDQVSRMQQTMLVTRRMLVRRLRSAGGGLTTNLWSTCGGDHQVGPFILHNRNQFGQTDTSNGGSDPDPDWFEIMSVDHSRSGVLSEAFPLSSQEIPTNQSSNFRPGDMFVLQNEHGACLLMVSQVQHNKIQHQPAGWGSSHLATCFNQSRSMTVCKNVMKTQNLPLGSSILNLGSGSAAFRIDDSNPKRPLLMMASSQAGGDPSQYDWQPIAEGVEDMQIAVQLDTSNPPDAIGDVWVNSRDLQTSELGKARAVRISLVFRSMSPASGWSSGRRPALEDRPAATNQDGYIRRILTTVVKLRNVPTEAKP